MIFPCPAPPAQAPWCDRLRGQVSGAPCFQARAVCWWAVYCRCRCRLASSRPCRWRALSWRRAIVTQAEGSRQAGNAGINVAPSSAAQPTLASRVAQLAEASSGWRGGAARSSNSYDRRGEGKELRATKTIQYSSAADCPLDAGLRLVQQQHQKLAQMQFCQRGSRRVSPISSSAGDNSV